MANPTTKFLKADKWVKVATNKTAGFIKQLSRRPRIYRETYRMTGESGPTNNSEGVPWQGALEIKSSAPIDVYVMSERINGRVRIDV
jgi:hypothetical protein